MSYSCKLLILEQTRNRTVIDMLEVFVSYKKQLFVTDQDFHGRNVLHVNYYPAMCSLKNQSLICSVAMSRYDINYSCASSEWNVALSLQGTRYQLNILSRKECEEPRVINSISTDAKLSNHCTQHDVGVTLNGMLILPTN